jgi:hypothetical protein
MLKLKKVLDIKNSKPTLAMAEKKREKARKQYCRVKRKSQKL